jgi:hypothetical protein
VNVVAEAISSFVSAKLFKIFKKTRNVIAGIDLRSVRIYCIINAINVNASVQSGRARTRGGGAYAFAVLARISIILSLHSKYFISHPRENRDKKRIYYFYTPLEG